MKVHELKIYPVYFNELINGNKKYELRKNDRYFEVGDTVLFREFIPAEFYEDQDQAYYTGRIATREISHILAENIGFGLMPGYVILSLKKI